MLHKLDSKLGLLLFSQGYISFPWYCARLHVAWDNVGNLVKLKPQKKKKKKRGPNWGRNDLF